MHRRALVLALLLAAGWPLWSAGSSAQAPPLGTVVVGTDPGLYDVFAAGAAAWNATGAVAFVVEATGCGTGDVTACWVWWEPGWHAGCYGCAGPGVIEVDAYDAALFTANEACHELGHALGLYPDDVHPPGPGTCMSSPPSGDYPDANDLANLGVGAPEPRPEPATGIVALPNTGSGSAAGR